MDQGISTRNWIFQAFDAKTICLRNVKYLSQKCEIFLNPQINPDIQLDQFNLEVELEESIGNYDLSYSGAFFDQIVSLRLLWDLNQQFF